MTDQFKTIQREFKVNGNPTILRQRDIWKYPTNN